MALTVTAILNAKSGKKTRRLTDGNGLYLEISKTGGKWWRFKYRFAGKEKRLSLGVFPAISLKAARGRRDEARKLVAGGVDPGEHRRAVKAAGAERAQNCFEVVALEWFDKRSPSWKPSHSDRILSRLKRDVFPWVGSRPITEISAPELLDVMRRIESRGALETAHRTLSSCGRVFRYGIATGRAVRDPSADLRGALMPVKGDHFASVTEPEQVARLLRMLDGYVGTPVVCAALRLAPLVFVRPGELRHARWADVDLEAAEWRYTVTKTNTQHVVPLADQAVEILRDLEPITRRSGFVFPSARGAGRPMSDNAILAAMRRMGIEKDEMSGHGFRAMARTILDEVLGFRPDIIEHQLAHAVRDPLGRAYNRTSHLQERKKMMQVWADYLDGLKRGAEVISLHRHA
jgi:integrase